ncbi:MAG: hypothetical protein U0L05_01435 [Schaedlerella sp.]|nr:hypothetical protein [Schaedlerella sp.]
MADGYLNFDTKIDEQGFNKGISKLSGLASKGMAVVGAAVAVGVAAFGAVTKAALDSVASMEQNLGGVETLFKDSADIVIDNANRAYETAGMSANEYMSTVTSFSASLLQSLGQDTKKAAKYADTAIRDMSDNANKMGTSMELIQNAYQGFAKQNYTMLDNLKLGYGGTKTEMERLLKAAEAIKAKNGEVVDYSIDKFGDVVQAIHTVQEEMGITGTTAREAASTIEGSMNAAKAAWDNFLNGSIFVEDFSEAVATAANNIIVTLSEIVPRLVETIPAAISGIVSAMSEQSETILNAGMQIVSFLVQGIVSGLPSLLIGAVQLIQYLANAIVTNLPAILNTGIQVITQFIAGIAQCLPGLAESAWMIISGLADYIMQNLPAVTVAGHEATGEFINGILKKLPDVIEAAGTILDGFVEYIMQNLPVVLDSGVELILSLVDGIIQSLPNIVSSAITVVTNLLTTVLSNAPRLIEGGITLIGKLAAGIIQAVPSLIGKIPGIISQIKSKFTSIDWGTIGKNIISGIARGISNAAGEIISAAKTAAQNALAAAKSALGIKSPSRVFRDQVGKMMALGMGIGFEKNIPIESMNRGVQTAVNSLKRKAVVATSVRTNPSVGSIKNHPDFDTIGKTNWDEWERRQRKLNRERDSRPIFLGTKRIDQPLPKGAVPQV